MPLYAAWMKELGLEMPVEELATCSNCPMCHTNGCEPETTFDQSTKRCTHIPILPNFLAGIILTDTDPSLVARTQTQRLRMRDRSSTTPLGVGFRADLRLIYESANVFGKGTAHHMA